MTEKYTSGVKTHLGLANPSVKMSVGGALGLQNT